MAVTDAQAIKATKARLSDIQDEALTRFETLKRDATRRAQIALGSARDKSLDVAYATSATVLDTAATVTRTLPLGKPLAQTLEKQAGGLTARQRALQTPPIANYDELNVKQVGDALDRLDAWELQKVRRYEAQNKNRKTVLGACDRLLR